MGRNLENITVEDKEYLSVLKVAVIAFVSTPSPQIAVEFARRVVPAEVRPSFVELEELVKKVKKG
jgi:chemotaxis protein MotA